MTSISNQFKAEESRIRLVYAGREKFRERYTLFNPGNLYLVQSLERHFLNVLTKHGFRRLGDKKILEIGCGDGFRLRQFIQWGASPENVEGVDLLSETIFQARRLCPAGVQVNENNAAQLKFPDNTFDLVVQFTLFTSVLDTDIQQRIAGEMLRVVKDDGMIVWYDFYVNNPRNPEVRGVGKRDIARLFPDCSVDLRKVTLAPPLARLIAPYSPLACNLLEVIPWLRTFYLAAIRRR